MMPHRIDQVVVEDAPQPREEFLRGRAGKPREVALHVDRRFLHDIRRRDTASESKRQASRGRIEKLVSRRVEKLPKRVLITTAGGDQEDGNPLRRHAGLSERFGGSCGIRHGTHRERIANSFAMRESDENRDKCRGITPGVQIGRRISLKTLRADFKQTKPRRQVSRTASRVSSRRPILADRLEKTACHRQSEKWWCRAEEDPGVVNLPLA
jgi:hypothetical protein